MTASFTLKNIPDAIYDQLKASARRHRRSINSEILVCLEEAYCSRRISPEEFLADAKAMRDAIGGPLMTAEEIQAAIENGRP
jgi:plasmid stability protein